MGSSDELTWKKPRSIAIVIVWSIVNASLILNAFLSGRQFLAWYDMLLVFSISAYAGVLLAETKTLILGVFESLFISVLLVYLGMILPVLLGDVAGFFQANIVYWDAMGFILKLFLFPPLGTVAHFLGGLLGWFAEGLFS